MPKVLMIVGDWSETLETYTPYFMMKSLGFTVDVVCPDKKKGDKIRTAVHDPSPVYTTCEEKPGHCFELTCTWSEIDPKPYQALWLPGGRAPEWLRTCPKVIEITRHFIETHKPIAATNHGPQILVACGGIQGKKITCFPTCAIEMTLAGADYTKPPMDECIVDGPIITGPTWMSLPKMMPKFVEMCGMKWPPMPPMGP